MRHPTINPATVITKTSKPVSWNERCYLSSPITHGAGNVFVPVKDPNRSLKIFIFNAVALGVLLWTGEPVNAMQEDTAKTRKRITWNDAAFIVVSRRSVFYTGKEETLSLAGSGTCGTASVSDLCSK